MNSYIIDSPQPSNISYLWNFGSLLALCLIIQIITGVTLGMHYTPNVLEAFDSVEHIMRDVNNGWLIRYLHSNTASAFFFLIYLHVGRGLYYGSYRAPRTLTWVIGTTILILMMATAFLGMSHCPRCSKLKISNNNNNNDINNNNNNNNNNRKKKLTIRSLASYEINIKSYRPNIKTSSKTINKKGIRYYSTSSLTSSIDKLSCKNCSDEVTKFIADKNLSPVFIYDYISTNNIRTKILNETRNLSGIYLILNKVSLDYYIGSASTGKIYSRFSNHLLHFKGSKIVKNAVKKYGINSFAFMVLDLFPEIVTRENNKRLLDLEDFYLKSLLPNYNILTEAGSSFGYKHTEITRIKMKTSYSKERANKIGSLNRGKNLSPETIEAMINAALNRKKAEYSPEGIKNMKKNSKAILVYNLDYTVFGEFPSIVDASKSLGCNPKTIRRALQSPKNILKRRWIVKYV